MCELMVCHMCRCFADNLYQADTISRLGQQQHAFIAAHHHASVHCDNGCAAASKTAAASAITGSRNSERALLTICVELARKCAQPETTTRPAQQPATHPFATMWHSHLLCIGSLGAAAEAAAAMQHLALPTTHGWVAQPPVSRQSLANQSGRLKVQYAQRTAAVPVHSVLVHILPLL